MKVRWYVALATLLIAALPYVSCGGPFYDFPPVNVQVLHYESEQPLHGVVVSARWYSSKAFCIHGNCVVEEIATAEARSGPDGRAHLRPSRRWRPPWLDVSSDSPIVLVHKRGYVVASGPSWDRPPGTGRYFLLAPLDFADGLRSFGEVARRVREDRYRAERRLPILEQEIQSTFVLLPKHAQAEVRASGGSNIQWLRNAP